MSREAIKARYAKCAQHPVWIMVGFIDRYKVLRHELVPVEVHKRKLASGGVTFVATPQNMDWSGELLNAPRLATLGKTPADAVQALRSRIESHHFAELDESFPVDEALDE